MRKIKLGILGSGPRGFGLLHYVYAHMPYAEITAICDWADGLAESTAKDFAELTGNKDIKVYHDYETMMRERNFEALFITIDPDRQVAFACDAMERGVHVMTEVPCCTDIEDCRKLVETVERTGMKYQLAEQTRYWPFIRQWRKMAEERKFGKILMVEGQYLHYEPTWDFFVDKRTKLHIQAGDGTLDGNPGYERSWRYRVLSHPIYYLPHTLSPLLSVTGGRIEKVACFGTKKGSYVMDGLEIRDLESAIMYNSEDVIFNVRAGFTSPHPHQEGTWAHWYHVKGTEETAEWARSEIDLPKSWKKDTGWKEMPNWSATDDSDEGWTKDSLHGGIDGYPLKTFAEAIVNDTVPPMDVYKAVETAAPAIMAAKSAELGGVLLDVPDFRKKK